MSSRNIKIQAHSQSIHKVVSRFQNEFDVVAAGSKPTEKLESIISQLKNKDSNISEELDALILEAYSIGAQSGFDRALARFQDGKVTSQKVPNKNEWALISSSKKYQITEGLPSAKGEVMKATVYLYLSDSGFE